EEFFSEFGDIAGLSGEIGAAYYSTYRELHEKRAGVFAGAIEEIKGRSEWIQIPEEMRAAILAPLSSRACAELNLPDGEIHCQNCDATLSQMESDIAALAGLKAQVVAHIQELVAPPEVEGTRIERVKVIEFFSKALETEQEVDEALERLREHLHK